MFNPYSDILKTIPPSGIREFFELVIGRDDVLSLGVGEPDFPTPWRFCEQAFYAVEKGRTTYTSNKGLLELRQAVSRYQERRFGNKFNPDDEILITVGGSEALDIAFRAILNPGDEIIVPEPAFVCYGPLTTLAGGKVVTIDTTKSDFKLTPEALQKALTPQTKAVVISYPNNPTGISLTVAEQEALVKVLAKSDCWIISDEIYSELVYEHTYRSWASYPEIASRVLLISGVSKAHAMTGWRIGYACGGEEIIAMMNKIHQYSIMCAPIVSQYAATEALDHGDEAVQVMRRSYEQRRNYFVAECRKIGVPLVEPHGAFYAFPEIKKYGLTSREFAKRLLDTEQVAMVPGTAFGACGEGYIRACYATSMDTIREALFRFGRFVRGL